MHEGPKAEHNKKRRLLMKFLETDIRLRLGAPLIRQDCWVPLLFEIWTTDFIPCRTLEQLSSLAGLDYLRWIDNAVQLMVACEVPGYWVEGAALNQLQQLPLPLWECLQLEDSSNQPSTVRPMVWSPKPGQDFGQMVSFHHSCPYYAVTWTAVNQVVALCMLAYSGYNDA